MTDLTLSKAAASLLERIASAHPLPFEASARRRGPARQLAEAGLIDCESDVCSLTETGLAHLGLPAGVGNKAPREGSKAAKVIALLLRDEGATIAQLSEATAWLPHSVRGFLAGALRKTHGLTATSEKIDDVRIYRLAAQ